MAEVVALQKEDLGSGCVAFWLGLKSGQAGVPMSESGYPARTVQASGDFSGGARVAIQGSNIGGGDENWFLLNDQHGNPLVFAMPGLAVIRECTRHTRPHVIDGCGADAAINIHIFAVKGSR